MKQAQAKFEASRIQVVPRAGLPLALMVVWLIGAVWFEAAMGHPVANWGGVIGAIAPIIVHLIVSKDRGYVAMSAEGLLVAAAVFYAVAVHGSVMLFGLLAVPSGYALSERGFVLASVCVLVYFVSAAFGLRMFPRRPVLAGALAPPISLSARRGIILALIGASGLALSFPTLDSLFSYWIGDISARSEPSGVLGFFSTATRSLLPLGLALAVTPWAKKSRGRAVVAVSMIVIVSVLVLSTFAFNRAVLIYPLIAVLLTAAQSGAKLRFSRLIVSFFLMVAAFFAIGFYRQSLNNPSSEIVAEQWVPLTLQVYGQLSNGLGVVFDNPEMFSLGSIISGFLGPIPGLGSNFRETTGTAIYNHVLYNAATIDQILPLWAEAWAVGGLGLVSVFGAASGVFARVLSNQTVGSVNVISKFAWNWALVWVSFSFLYSTSNLSQAFIYMVIPVILAGLNLQRRARSHGWSQLAR